MGSMQHGPNGGIYRQVSSRFVCYNVIYVMSTYLFNLCPGNNDQSQRTSNHFTEMENRIDKIKKKVCLSLFICRYVKLCVFVCVWFQVNTVGYLINGAGGDQDGSLSEDEILGGAEIQETEEDPPSLSRERRRSVFLK